jgi:uncharacterized protein (DUF2267 family)
MDSEFAGSRSGGLPRRGRRLVPRLLSRSFMTERRFIEEVADALRCDRQRAESVIFAVFRELSHRLTASEAADVASQLPAGLKRLWSTRGALDRSVEKIHRAELIGRVRQSAVLPDDEEAERAVRAVFRALQRQLGSPSGREGEAWDVFSQLPKDLKQIWLDAARD